MAERKLGVFGHYGHENLGDEAIIQACLQRIPEVLPHTEFVLFSSRPEDSSRRHNWPAYPIRRPQEGSLTSSEQLARDRALNIDYKGTPSSADANSEQPRWKQVLKRLPVLWTVLRAIKSLPAGLISLNKEVLFLWASRQRVKSLDLLLITGSNQFLDNVGGPTGFPYTLFKWTLLARSAGVPVAFISVGAGPLSSPKSSWMIRSALRFACYLSFRDKASQHLVDPKGRYGSKVYPDLAFAISTPEESSTANLTRGNAIIAINPMPVYDARYWYINDPVKYESYVSQLTSFVEVLLKKQYVPKLFATQPKDENVITDIVVQLLARGVAKAQVDNLYWRVESVDDLLRILKLATVVVPTRFHGTVLGLWAGKPTIGICYYRKAADLLTEFGLGRFAYDLDDVSAAQLVTAVDELIDSYDSICKDVNLRRQQYIDDLQTQFERLKLLPGLSG